jgi:hypothetical protein
MVAKKFKNLFIQSSERKLAASKKTGANVEPAISKTPSPSQSENIKDKAEIEAFKKAIEKKLKDPEMAKKAAQIIEELLKK